MLWIHYTQRVLRGMLAHARTHAARPYPVSTHTKASLPSSGSRDSLSCANYTCDYSRSENERARTKSLSFNLEAEASLRLWELSHRRRGYRGYSLTRDEYHPGRSNPSELHLTLTRSTSSPVLLNYAEALTNFPTPGLKSSRDGLDPLQPFDTAELSLIGSPIYEYCTRDLGYLINFVLCTFRSLRTLIRRSDYFVTV